MAFEEVLDLSCDVTISLGGTNKKTGKVNPTKIEGYYLGKRQVEDRKKKSGFSYIYAFQTSKGNVGVWGKTDLDRKMSVAPLGTMLRITQNGTVATPNGDMYKFKVEFDKANTISVPAQEEATTSSFVSEGSETGWSEESGDESAFEEAAPLDEAPTARPSGVRNARSEGSAAERAARQQALLNSSRRT